MFLAVQNILAILNGYVNGKHFECKKGKLGRRISLNDLVSISDEAREKSLLDGEESGFRDADDDTIRN